MSRSGYNDYDGDFSNIRAINWRGAVASALRGCRGQAFLKRMLAALDAMPVKELIGGDLVTFDGQVCALGAVAQTEGIPTGDLDPEDAYGTANRFGIAHAMACEIMFENDEAGSYWKDEDPAKRHARVREWVAKQIVDKEV